MIVPVLWIGAVASLSIADDPPPPPNVIHVVYVKWKDEATAEQKGAALNGARALEGKGPDKVYIKSNIKDSFNDSSTPAIPKFDDAIVMIFKDQKSLDGYAGSQAQNAWYKLYIPIRKDSRSVNVTNDPPPPPPANKGGGTGAKKVSTTKETPAVPGSSAGKK